MIYSQRRTPFEAPVEWRLDGDALIRRGKATRSFPLQTLRSARLIASRRRQGPRTLTLRLGFRTGTAVIGSHGFGAGFAYADQTAAFAPFVRALLARAGAEAPDARYEIGSDRAGGVFVGAGAVLGAGLALVLLAAITAGQFTLGLEMAARLAFVLILMVAVWPWLAGLSVRRFDPAAPPLELLS